ncbi:MAG TPA: tetratricopeptide repeat protein [Pyrinomonadaceae bacterium]|nr:tetratricopeptide repeat protein [Pyrinomonadaceae bacterium]
MSVKLFQRLIVLGGATLLLGVVVTAQSTRPRRVQSKAEPKQTAAKTSSKPDSLLLPQPTPAPAVRNTNVPLLDVKPVKPIADSSAPVGLDTGDTTHAFTMFQQKQYDAALKEAKLIAKNDPQNSEAWKIAGFSELALKQYSPAAKDLETALNLQEVAKQDDPPTSDALAQAYVLSEKFDQALPLLVKATTRAGAEPDPLMLYYRGWAEYKTGKVGEAERTFNAVVKANPRDTNSLYFLGQIALAKNDLGGAIASFNRVTVNDPKMAGGWMLLTSSYLRRAATATDQAAADADYLSAVRAGEGLIKVRTDAEAVTLFGQALIGARQYPRAVAALERLSVSLEATSVSLYLLGVAQSRVKNFPKAIAALERAAEKKPDDVNVYRELGYAFEVSKQYAKALGAYQKGLSLVPDDTDFKESVERVKPFAK